MTRAEHVAWAKGRALEALDAPGISRERAIAGALASMASDLAKHPETGGRIGLMLGMQEIIIGSIATRDQMRRHIEGYN